MGLTGACMHACNPGARFISLGSSDSHLWAWAWAWFGSPGILGELFTRTPIFPGTSELEVLGEISVICGSPNTKVSIRSGLVRSQL